MIKNVSAYFKNAQLTTSLQLTDKALYLATESFFSFFCWKRLHRSKSDRHGMSIIGSFLLVNCKEALKLTFMLTNF